jgi:hypothetical protein
MGHIRHSAISSQQNGAAFQHCSKTIAVLRQQTGQMRSNKGTGPQTKCGRSLAEIKSLNRSCAKGSFYLPNKCKMQSLEKPHAYNTQTILNASSLESHSLVAGGEVENAAPVFRVRYTLSFFLYALSPFL